MSDSEEQLRELFESQLDEYTELSSFESDWYEEWLDSNWEVLKQISSLASSESPLSDLTSETRIIGESDTVDENKTEFDLGGFDSIFFSSSKSSDVSTSELKQAIEEGKLDYSGLLETVIEFVLLFVERVNSREEAEELYQFEQENRNGSTTGFSPGDIDELRAKKEELKTMKSLISNQKKLLPDTHFTTRPQVGEIWEIESNGAYNTPVKYTVQVRDLQKAEFPKTSSSPPVVVAEILEKEGGLSEVGTITEFEPEWFNNGTLTN